MAKELFFDPRHRQMCCPTYVPQRSDGGGALVALLGAALLAILAACSGCCDCGKHDCYREAPPPRSYEHDRFATVQQ